MEKDFAVVKIKGKQYLVSLGDQITVSGNLGKVGQKLIWAEVLLLQKGGKLIIGTPLVEKAAVKTEIISEGKGPKIRVSKFKAKSRYRRVMGFRPLETQLKILSIGEPAKKSPAKNRV